MEGAASVGTACMAACDHFSLAVVEVVKSCSCGTKVISKNNEQPRHAMGTKHMKLHLQLICWSEPMMNVNQHPLTFSAALASRNICHNA